MDQQTKDQIAPVLGRVPSGVFILVAGDGNGKTTGLLASWVQQASFEPPQVTVAVNKTRYLNGWLSNGSAVTLNQLPEGDAVLFKHFGKGFEPDADAFDGVDVTEGENGLPLLKAAMSSLEGQVVGDLDAGDHVIYLIELATAAVHRSTDDFAPFIHVRKNGFHY